MFFTYSLRFDFEGAEEEASQGSLLSNGTTESSKKKVRLEVYDPDR